MNTCHRFPSPRSLPLSAAIIAMCATGLFARIWHFTSPSASAPNTGQIRVEPAVVLSLRSKATAVSLRNEPAPLQVRVDATRSAPSNLAGLSMVREQLIAIAGRPASLGIAARQREGQKEEQREDAEQVRDWNLWGRLSAAPAPIIVEGPTTPDPLDLYAIHSREGATVCLINRSQSYRNVQLHIRFDPGPYRVERLTFTPRNTQVSLPSDRRFLTEDARLPVSGELMRFQGHDLSRPGSVTMPVALASGEICLVRYLDSAYASRAALNDVREQSRSLPRASVDLARRIHVIMEGTGFIDRAIAANCRLDPSRRCGEIHRFLLVLGQVHSLHRNFQEQHAVDQQAGAAFLQAVERLEDALSDVSATLMCLVPRIEVAVDPPDAARAVTAHVRAVRDEEPAPHSARVMITLTNGGARSAELVKIGLSQALLPSGVRCEPPEPAFFGSLAPGQTVRAVFLLHWKGASSFPANCCVGDTSYFASGAPAHLRVRPW